MNNPNQAGETMGNEMPMGDAPQGALSQLQGQNREVNMDDPRLLRLINPIIESIAQEGIPPEALEQMFNLLKYALENPDAYGDIRNQLISAGALDDSDLPKEYDGRFLSMILIATKIVLNKMQSEERQSGVQQVVPEEEAPSGTPEIMLARGGLAKLAVQGRRGDTKLAHISPFEDKLLRSYGGSGAINPNTGLPEYGFLSSVTKVLKKIAPIALPVAMIAMPWLAPAIGGVFGATGLTATMIGGSILGGATSALTGGNMLKGALLGGLASGLAPAIGSGVSDALGLGLSQTGAAALGGGMVGAGAGYATTGTAEGALKGAAIGSVASGVGQAGASAAGTGSALATGLGQAARSAGAGLTAGYSPKESAIMGLTSGAIAGAQYQPVNPRIARAAGINVPEESLLGVNTKLSAPSISGMTQLPTNAPSGINYNPENFGMNIHPSNPAIEEMYAPDDYATQSQIDTGVANPSQLTPSDLQSAHESTLTKYANGLGTAPGTTMYDEAGRTGTTQMNPKTGNIEFVPNAGEFKYNPESNAVEWSSKQPTPSLWDRATGYFTGNQPTVSSDASGATSWGKYAGMGLAGLAAASALSSAPSEVQSAVSQLTPSQQEYFNRPSVTWDWNKMQRDASANNMSLSDYMARSWPNITSGTYNMARGGALNTISHYVTGGGTGRSDSIDAKLSDGEYVIDAETVALLGDGSNKAGAKRLDEMRRAIRAHKGKTLSRGGISPDAKSPLAYLRGV